MKTTTLKISVLKTAIIFILLTLITACSPLKPPTGYAECPICKANNDLACLYVKKNKASYQHKSEDKTVYFCSKECKTQHLEKQ